jgi:hypothetical protein
VSDDGLGRAPLAPIWRSNSLVTGLNVPDRWTFKEYGSPMKNVLLAILLAACGSTAKPASTATPPAARTAPEVTDNRCTMPQIWLRPGRGFKDAYTEGCQTKCDKLNAPPDYWPDAGAAEVCGEEVYLCLPARSRSSS